MKDVANFLLKNGFLEMGKDSYANHLCNVVFQEGGGYAVADNEGNTMYSNDNNIYWLIGTLTYYDYMDRHYVK